MVLTAVDERAEHTGLMPGMRLVDARALVAGITVEKADPVTDQQALVQLGLWCGRFTPRVACDGADGLLLDVTGCSHLFGGEQAMMQTVSKRLTRLGLETRLGLADTPGAARALARFAPEHQRIVKPGKVRAALKTLPVEALGVTRSNTLTLRHLGLSTIGAITRLPRAARSADSHPAAPKTGCFSASTRCSATGTNISPSWPRHRFIGGVWTSRNRSCTERDWKRRWPI